MEIATFDYEREYFREGFRDVVGIDEAGRGPLAGPVVAAACIIRDKHIITDHDDEDALWMYVRDSKKVSAKKRQDVYTFIREHFSCGVGIVHPETIDRMNILQATFHAMKAAWSDVKKSIKNDAEVLLLIDGSHTIPHLTIAQKAITKGDAKVKSIAAASIIAKVTRDRLMVEYDALFPQYGFARHKGYGTKKHMEALRTYGATPIHRKSFGPVKKVL